jgi:hypothetical protein
MHRAIDELDPKMFYRARFIEDSPPKLIVEKTDFPGNANSNAKVSFGGGQGTSGKIGRVTNPLRHMQDLLPGGLVDAASAVQSSIDGTNRYIRQLGDKVNTLNFCFLAGHQETPGGEEFRPADTQIMLAPCTCQRYASDVGNPSRVAGNYFLAGFYPDYRQLHGKILYCNLCMARQALDPKILHGRKVVGVKC